MQPDHRRHPQQSRLSVTLHYVLLPMELPEARTEAACVHSRVRCYDPVEQRAEPEQRILRRAQRRKEGWSDERCCIGEMLRREQGKAAVRDSRV